MAGRWFAWLALAISYNFGCDFGSLGDGWRWLGDSWENTCCIITPNKKKQDHQYNTQPYSTQTTQHRMAGWLALAFSRTTSNVNLNCREMAGWLAPPSSNDFVCNCLSLRDGWVMAGLLALAISNDFRCHLGTVGDGWEMAGRTLVVLEHPIQTNTVSTTNKPYSTL